MLSFDEFLLSIIFLERKKPNMELGVTVVCFAKRWRWGVSIFAKKVS